MTPREELSELNRRAKHWHSRIEEHKREIAYHESHIEFDRKAIENIQQQKQHFFRDSDMEPYALMTPAQQRRVDKMPLAEEPCEFCESSEVRKGKKNVCMRCGHEQSQTPEPKA